MTMTTNYNIIAKVAMVSLLLGIHMNAYGNSGFNHPLPVEGVFHHINKSTDANFIHDLRGYPNSQPILKLEEAIAPMGDGSFGFSEYAPSSVSCNGNLNFTVDPTACERTITIPPPTSDCTITAMSYNITGGPSAPIGTTPTDPSGTYQVGTYTINWSITDCDGVGLCVQTISVLDMTAPVLTCPMSLNLSCITDPIPPALTTFAEFEAEGGQASDNCDIDPASFILLTEVMTGTSCNLTIVREYQLMDVNGQSSNCTRSIFIVDNIQPDFTDPIDVTISCDQDPTDLSITGDVTNETDNCDVPAPQAVFTDNNMLFTCGNSTGTITRTWTLTDACGNFRNRNQLITVQDIVPPALDCTSVTDLILECDGDYTAEINTWLANNEAAVLAGATELCSNVTVSNNYISGLLPAMSCDVSSGLQITFTATDECGNASSCTAMLILDDNTAPLIDCSVVSNLTLDCDGDYTTEINDWITNTENAITSSAATVDLCTGSVTISNNYNGAIPALSCTGIPGAIVTYTVVDGCMNSASCTASIIIQDITPPVAQCQDVTIDLDAVGEAFLSTIAVDNGSFDNCDETLSFSLSRTDFFCNDVIASPVMVTMTVTDDCGNSSTCTTNLTVRDMDMPTIECPSALTAVCNISEEPAYVDFDAFIAAGGTYTDMCSPNELSFSVSEVTDGATCPETITRTYSVADFGGNVATCQQVITVNDLTFPTIVSPPNVVVSSTNGTCEAMATVGMPTTNDNCGIASTVNNYNNTSDATDIYPVGVTTVVWTTTDLCGNMSTNSMTVTVNDNTAPVLSGCPSSITSNTDPNSCTAAVSLVVPTAVDDCGVVSITNNITTIADASSIFPLGSTLVVFTATDANNNTATCSATITVEDNMNPEISCPPALTAICDINEIPAYASLTEFTNAGGTATDNCGIDGASFILTSETTNGATCPEIITRVYEIMDESGNVTTCSQTITINDETLPTIDCTANITVAADPSACNAFVTIPIPTVTDNCGVISTVNSFNSTADASGTYNVGTTTVVWTVTDACGNTAQCTTTVIVQDNQIPTITCPATLMASCDISEQVPYADLDAFIAAGGSVGDNCMIDPASFTLVSNVSDGLSCPETFIRIYRIEDISGNFASCSQMVIVDDVNAPVLLGCPVDITITAATNACNANVTLAIPTATDNCGAPVITNNITTTSDASGVYPVGVTQVIFTATDACGNATTCSANITVLDEMPPTFACPADLTANCDPNEQVPYTSLSELVAAGGFIFENCTIDPNSFTYLGEVSDNMSCPETFTRTYEISDIFGNTTECNQMVIVNDEILPMITCSSDITVNADAGICGASITISTPISSDNCGVASVTNDFNNTANASGIYPVGLTTVVWTVTDDCGNINNCSFTITVNDLIVPSITCPAALTTSCDAADIAPYATTTDFIAAGGAIMDNCGFQESGFILLSTVSDGNTCPEIVTRTYQITDLSGNTATCSQTITVNDIVPPVLSCGLDITVNATAGQCDAMVTIAIPAPTDNCGILSLTNDFNGLADASGMFPVGTTPVTWTATDNCMNAVDCTISVTVMESELPSLNCPPAITAVCSISEQPAYMSLIEFEAAGGTATDNCTIDPTSFTLLSATSDGLTCPETITRIYQISDVNGNVNTCSHVLTIDDNIAPTIICAGDFTVSTDTGVCSAMVTLSIPVTNDNCSVNSLINNITNTADASGVYPLGTTMIIWTVTDQCGNTTTCEVNVTVEDNELPTITCPPALTAICDISEQPVYSDLAAFIAAGGVVNDNCDMDLTLSTLIDVSDGNMCPEVFTRTYIVTDDDGNTASCQQMITVDDEVLPEITCPLDITVNAVSGTCEAMVSISIPTATDNCGVADVINDYTGTNDASGMYDVGTTVVTYTVRDNCGNESTCSFNVTVADVDPPVIFCGLTVPVPLYLDCDADFVNLINAFLAETGDKVLNNPGTFDLCDPMLELSNDYDGTSIPPFSCDGSVGLNLNFIVTDDFGNSASCPIIIAVRDLVAPVFDVLPDPIANISCDDPFPDQQDITATDNCSLATVVESVDPFVVDQCIGYNVTYRWTATDDCGNTTETQQTFLVLPDTEGPVFDNAPAPVADLNCDDPLPDPQVITASDGCQTGPAIVVAVIDPFTVNQCDGYAVNYTWTATDNCGNTSTLTQIVNVLPDTTPPVFDNLPTPIADINCDDMFPTPEVLTATDACQDNLPIVVFDILPFTVDQCAGYEVTYRWRTRDNCANVVEVTESFDVLPDTEGPVFDNLPMALPDINCNDALPTQEVRTATDACQTDAVTVVATVDNFNVNICSGYAITYRWTATDNCGNTTEVTSSFNVLPDTESPTFDMAAPMIGDINCDDVFPLFPVVTASDNCDPSPDITTEVLPFVVDQCAGYPVTYQWTATDACNNTAILTTVFNVLADTTPPVFDSQPTPIADINCDDSLPVQETLTATDACGVDDVVASVDPFTIDICAGYDITYRWVATDACGNASTVTETFSVLPDTEGPVFDSQPTPLADINCDDALHVQEILTATDDCSTFIIVATIDPFTVDLCAGYAITHRWVATDNCGNSTVVTETYNVLPDTEAPVFDNNPTAITPIACSDMFPDQEDLTATDDCNTVTVVESIDPYIVDQCNGYEVTYRWTATDACGNSSEVTTTFSVLPDTTNPIFDAAPATIADIACSDMLPVQETLTATDDCGTVTVVPSVDPYTVDICAGYSITYRWVATDACGLTAEVFTSFNVLADTQGPIITCTDITVGTDDGVCEATIMVPAPPITDDCSAFTVTNDLTNTDNADATYQLGTTSIVWTVTDDCGNMNTCTQQITVVDDESPIISCNNNIIVALENNGMATIPADDFILMATDNCGTTNIRVSRMETNGGPCNIADNDVLGTSVSFCCADAANADGEVMVMVVVDDGNGNETPCMVTVKVIDTIDPSLVPPSMCLPDITISCEFPLDITDLSVFGSIVFDAADVEDIELIDTFYFNTGYIAGQDALFTDNCLDGITVTESIAGFDTFICNQGTFTRTLVVTDLSGNTASCVQSITVDDLLPFTEDDIIWPADYEITDCTMVDTNPDITGRPILNVDKCSQPGASFKDKVFDYPISGCQLIERTWTVLDWCQYVPNSGSTLGLFSYVQIITVTNTVAPTFTFACQDTTICANEMTCNGELDIVATATDDCTIASQLYWSHSIDLFNAGSTVFTKIGNRLTGTYPRGTHKVTWTVEDRCGNVSTCEYMLTIRDCKAPQVVCKYGLSTSLMPMNGGGMVQIWANDFVKHGSDNCTLADDIIYSFSSDTTVSGVTFTCDDLGPQQVEVWATDEDGNQSFCITFIDIQDNSEVCGNTLEPIANVSGNLRTISDQGILDAEVAIESIEMAEYMMSENEGEYAFIDVPMYSNYEIRPYKNDDPMNGVSTLDLLMIQKHILAIQPLDSPYKLIAADVNNSGQVSAIDLIELRKLILGVLSEFPNNTSWRFIDENHVFDNPSQPWNFNEAISLENLSYDEMEANFIGIKIGDINGNVQANNLDEGLLENRSDFKGIQLYTEDQNFEYNESISVPISVSKFENISGLQMTIDYDAEILEYKGFSSDDFNLGQDNVYHYEENDGKLTISWSDVNAVDMIDGAQFINIFFRAKQQGRLEGMITINSSATRAEVYNEDLQVGNIGFEILKTQTQVFELLQNNPNPFNDQTEISFVLPEDMNTTFIIYDGAGKLLYADKKEYKAGLNTIVINKSDLNVTSGVLFYKLKAGNFTQIKQMLLIE